MIIEFSPILRSLEQEVPRRVLLRRAARIALVTATPTLLTAEAKPATIPPTPVLNHYVYLPISEKSPDPEKDNLIPNPSFEEVGPDSLPVGWQKSMNPSLAQYFQTGGNTGMGFIEMWVEALIRQGETTISYFPGKWATRERMPVDPTKDYQAAFFTKKEQVTEIPLGPWISLTCYNTAMQRLKSIDVTYFTTNAITNWVQLKMTVGPTGSNPWPTGTASVGIEFSATIRRTHDVSPGYVGHTEVDDVTFGRI